VLASSEITAVDAFYARNHGPFPDIPAGQWRLSVDGRVDKPLTLTYDQLSTDFEQHSVVATLACAGQPARRTACGAPDPGQGPMSSPAPKPEPS
jgi:sulfite oxidase